MRNFWKQTVALFHDAYRQMNSKRMFWISLVISGVVVLTFLAISVSDDGQLSIFGVALPLPVQFTKAQIYTIAFNSLGIGIWFTFIGMILALISTASVFPDWVTGGSIDLYLSKPIGRLRLFLTKYVTGLLFVALQVLVFCAASFLVIGLRGKLWQPGIFLAVPIVVCFFSYLYSICVLVGLLTRSTTAAFLSTMIFWLLLTGLDRADIVGLMGEQASQQNIKTIDLRLMQQRVSLLARREVFASTQPSDAEQQDLQERERHVKQLASQQADEQHSLNNILFVHRLILEIKTFLPKTRETADLLNRYLMSSSELEDFNSTRLPGRPMPLFHAPRPHLDERGRNWTDPQVIAETSKQLEKRSVWWIVGWSLVFEAAVVGISSWIFCRRDY